MINETSTFQGTCENIKNVNLMIQNKGASISSSIVKNEINTSVYNNSGRNTYSNGIYNFSTGQNFEGESKKKRSNIAKWEWKNRPEGEVWLLPSWGKISLIMSCPHYGDVVVSLIQGMLDPGREFKANHFLKINLYLL